MSVHVDWVSPQIDLSKVTQNEVIGRLTITKADLKDMVDVIYKALFTQAVFEAIPEIKTLPPDLSAKMLNDVSKMNPASVMDKYKDYAKCIVETIFGINLLDPAEAEKAGYLKNTTRKVTVN